MNNQLSFESNLIEVKKGNDKLIFLAFYVLLD